MQDVFRVFQIAHEACSESHEPTVLTLEVLEIKNSEHSAEWLAEAEAFADQMRGEMVPTPIFDRALKARDEFRRQSVEKASEESSP